MTFHRFATVLFKALGVYFLVQGVSLIFVMIAYLTTRFFGVEYREEITALHVGMTLSGFVRPIWELFAAYLLIAKTEWCLSKLRLSGDENQEDGDA